MTFPILDFLSFFSRRFWGLAFLWFPAAIIIRCISMRFVFCNKTWESEIIKARKDQLKHLSPTKSVEQKSKWTEMHFPMQNKYGDINSHNCLRVHLLHHRFLTLSWKIHIMYVYSKTKCTVACKPEQKVRTKYTVHVSPNKKPEQNVPYI